MLVQALVDRFEQESPFTVMVRAALENALSAERLEIWTDVSGMMTADPRFVENPLVTGELGIRFYAGMPLVSAEGAAFGTVCTCSIHSRSVSGSINGVSP